MPPNPTRWGKEIAADRDFAPADLLVDFGADTFDSEFAVETQNRVAARMLRRPAKERCLSMMRGQHLRDVLKRTPAKGHSLHIVTNNKADFWTWIPHLVKLLGHADEAYFSTWTISRSNARELLDLFDKKKLRAVAVLSGRYFKARESSIYAELLDGLLNRRQRFVCLENHAKVALLANHKSGHYITVEGSANFTSNPRIEQCVILNRKDVFAFHLAWMTEALSRETQAQT